MQPTPLFRLLPRLRTHAAEPTRPHVLTASPGIVPLSFTVVTQWSHRLPFDDEVRFSVGAGNFYLRGRVRDDSIRPISMLYCLVPRNVCWERVVGA